MDFKYICGDLETESLRPKLIHMIGVYDLINDEYRSYVGPDQVGEACYRMATESRMIVGHNFLGFDTKAIEKLTGLAIDRTVIVDTVLASRRYCTLPNHKLETWGELLGLPKLKQPIFERYTPQMDRYCERDVRLNVRVFEHLIDLAIADNDIEGLPNHQAVIEFLAERYPA